MTSSNCIPIISNNLIFPPIWTLSGLFYASLSTISPTIVQFCFIISSLICLASRPQIVRLIGTAWTSTSTSGIASIAKHPRTFIHPVSYSSLSLIPLSIIYALTSPLYSFFTAYILQVSSSPTAWSLYTRAQLFYFKVTLWLVVSPIRIIILQISIGLQVAYLIAQGIKGIKGIIAVTYAYNYGPIGISPLFIAIIITFQRALISIQITFISWAYSSQVSVREPLAQSVPPLGRQYIYNLLLPYPPLPSLVVNLVFTLSNRP